MKHTIQALLQTGVAQLRATSPTPHLDAEILLAHLLCWGRAHLCANAKESVTLCVREAFLHLIHRRANLEPIAYLVGHREFYGLEFIVDSRVLIPRPETELLVDIVQDMIQQWYQQPLATKEPLLLADVGTGSGAIAIALAIKEPRIHHMYATDTSIETLAVANINIQHYHLQKRITLLHGDMLEPLPNPVHIIVSNPPYTILSDVAAGVYRYEPHLALDGGPDGLDAYRQLIAQAPHWLLPGGTIALEIGATQANDVYQILLQTFPTAHIAMHQDLAGHNRVIIASQNAYPDTRTNSYEATLSLPVKSSTI